MAMKTEDSPTQPLSQSATPTQAYTAPQWATAQIPIDPALQQQSQTTATTAYQHYQAYTSHYPQAAYAHYQAYAPQQSQPVAAARPAAAQAPAGSGMDTADIATLNDALGSAGVDLRAEEESLQRSHDQHQSYRSYEDRTRKQPSKPAFDTRILGTTMRAVGTQHKITRIPEDSVSYLALALRARLQDLVTAMITASHHRTDTQFDRPASFYEDGATPMWSILVRSDVAKQLTALEKVEREEETKIRKERKERMEMAAAHAAALAAQATGAGLGADSLAGGAGGADDEGTKRKRKKEGPGVTARNMSEDVRKKMSNAVATQAAGLGGKYAWMNAANAAAANATPKPKPAPAAPSTPAPAAAASSPVTPAAPSPATTTAPAAGASTGTGSSWARPYVPTKKTDQWATLTPAEEDTRTLVTMRDAMFVVEKERGHGGGKGAARGWV